MIKNSLRDFVDLILEQGSLGADDVRRLQREVLADGISTREEADVLIALDRAVAIQDAVWEPYLVAAVVQFAVWTSRPTGYIDADAARWLTTTLGCGSGPTERAARIASEVVREAEQVHETLLTFVLQAGHGHRRTKPRLDLAA